MSSNNKIKIYLIGDPSKNMPERKLPTSQNVLSLFFYNYKVLALSINQSYSQAITEVQTRWARAQLPTKRKDHCLSKLKKLYNDWNKLSKSRFNIKSPTQLRNESIFLERIRNIFDISCQDIDKLVTKDQNYFFKAQCQPTRRGLISAGCPDNNTNSDNNNNSDNINNCDYNNNDHDNNINDYNKDNNENNNYNNQKIYENREELENLNNIASKEPEIIEILAGEKGKEIDSQKFSSARLKRISVLNDDEQIPTKKQKIVTPLIASVLDRTNTTDRSAMFIIAAVIIGLGHNLNEYHLSASTVRRCRMEFRNKLSNDLKNHLQINNYLVAHFDGKILHDIVGHEMVDRIPVTVSGMNTSHLLGAPKITNGTGHQQADAVVQILKEWKLDTRVKALCFDTTNSNTGRLNGAAVLIEKKL
ncbi:probable serine/threonine-protein kinase DDB_G0288147 [Aphidius gifuensis]|uniref:probable serine/threonine-protein kinase DDB_G0288147 n=1 Tax=Aphidius gifuensis TaxID=684658 RepID=UPI001CDD1649|nr:probable serine/threonine-protein kinase DDB_G0288147 [Aphidius gifuensis]